MEHLKHHRNWMTIPTLSCNEIEATLTFWEILGFKITYKMLRPYQYGVVERNGYELHFARLKELDITKNEDGCLIMVSDVKKAYKELTQKLKENLGKIPNSGIPRISRMKPEASRFTLIDVSGNCVIFIMDDEKDEEIYKQADNTNQTPLQQSIATAIRFRDYKEDEKKASQTLEIALKISENEALIDIAEALIMRIDLAISAKDSICEKECKEQLYQLKLADNVKKQLARKHDVEI